MFEIIFELDPYDENRTGFDLGHVTLTKDEFSLSSKPFGSKKLMMIFVSIVDFLSGIEELVQKKTGRYEFIGTDSSYFLNFVADSKGGVSVSQTDGKSLHLTADELVSGIYRSVVQFWDLQKPNLLPDDPVIEDVDAQIESFGEIADRYRD